MYNTCTYGNPKCISSKIQKCYSCILNSCILLSVIIKGTCVPFLLNIFFNGSTNEILRNLRKSLSHCTIKISILIQRTYICRILNYSLKRPLQWRRSLEHSTRKLKGGFWNSSRHRPTSFKQVVAAPLPNARQEVCHGS